MLMLTSGGLHAEIIVDPVTTVYFFYSSCLCCYYYWMEINLNAAASRVRRRTFAIVHHKGSFLLRPVVISIPARLFDS